MKYVSTRGGEAVSLDTALVQGIAPDGGLFLPKMFPNFSPEDFASCENIQDTARKLLAPFFVGSQLQASLPEIVAETFHFDIPVTWHGTESDQFGLLELFHGPTAAFKDVGAAFLAACISRLEGDEASPLTIIVATSGDTGGAVAAAFNERPGMRVVVLYPDGRVSERQAHQLTCWGDNVLSLAVQGSFDDCQALAKGAFADQNLSSRYRFSSANSINIGRLLPQSIYYAHSSLQHFASGRGRANFIVPTGNLGNGLACVMAREMGFPIGDVIFSTNANRTIADFLAKGEWQPRQSIATLASAMDVGNPSNMERMRKLFGEGEDLARLVSVVSVTDDQIREQIKINYDDLGTVTCPHTATATFAWRNFAKDVAPDGNWICVATAHAAKFEQVVEPVIGQSVDLPPELREILSRPQRFVQIEPDADQVANAMDQYFSS